MGHGTDIIMPINSILIFFVITTSSTEAFVSFSHDISRALIIRHGRQSWTAQQERRHNILSLITDDSSSELDVRLTASRSAGIGQNELPSVLKAIAAVCQEFCITFEHSSIQTDPSPLRLESIPGALGRVLLINVSGLPDDVDVDDTEVISQIKVYASEQIDNVLCGDEESKQPILLAFRHEHSNDNLDDIIAKEVSDYGLRDAISESTMKINSEMMFLPSQHIQIDGAFVETIDAPVSRQHFDTSSVIVFDNLVSKDLRKRLLNVVNGIPEEEVDDWHDVDGPKPNRWERDSLMDIAGESMNIEPDGSCWGLGPDAIRDICFNHHPAVAEFEGTLSQLFSDFTISRLPEAVFGECISPLTANAPTHGDSFDYHIDADPLQVPPSPWADVFGRYPNRSKGKPRFISCLMYLNEFWEPSWGAPTQFFDPPTLEVVDIMPKSGRCVIMDQDISHTVVAPCSDAGKRPRFSLVWKLILHPKRLNQDMTDLSCGRSWIDSQVIGSARETT